MAPDNDNFEKCMAYLEDIPQQKAELDKATSIANIMKPFKPGFKHCWASDLQEMVKGLGVGVVVFVYFDQDKEEDKPFFSGEHEDDYYLPYQKWAFKECCHKEHSEYIHSLYEITRDFQKNKAEYRVWVDSEDDKGDKREYEYVDYGECIAYQLLWRYLVHHSCDSTYTSVEKGIKERHKEKKLDEFALKNSSFKEDVDSIFFDRDGICKEAFFNFCRLPDVDVDVEDVDVDVESEICTVVENLKKKLKITDLRNLHEKAPLPIAPYYYWNTISKQHRTHMHYPVWLHIPLKIEDENKPRIGCVCLTAVEPFQNEKDETLQGITFNGRDCNNAAGVRRLRKIKRFTKCLALPYIDHFTYKNIRQSSLRNAVSAIMGRNMSHNIGSHVIARYAAKAGEQQEQRDQVLKKGVEDHRAVFLRYLQRRMDFIAEMATSDNSNWSQPLELVEELKALKYDEAEGRINDKNKKEKRFKPILLSYITGKSDNSNDEIRASVDPDNIEDLNFNCPSGEVGVHALYIIMENIIRNSARHNLEIKEEIRLRVKEVKDEEHTDLLKLVIIDCQTKCNSRLVKKINEIIKSSLLKADGSPDPGNWGIREMQICAQHLRGFKLSDLEMSNDPPVLEAINDEGYLAYQLYLQRAKRCALVICSKEFGELDSKQEILKEMGISLYEEEVPASKVQDYSFVVFPKGKKEEGIEWPIHTFEDVEINRLLKIGRYQHQYNDLVKLLEDSAKKSDPEILMEPLNEVLWRSYLKKINDQKVEAKKIKDIRAYVGWEEFQENHKNRGLFTHMQKAQLSYVYNYVFGAQELTDMQRGRLMDEINRWCNPSEKKEASRREELLCGLRDTNQGAIMWFDHSTNRDFEPKPKEPFIFSENLDSLSPHKSILKAILDDGDDGDDRKVKGNELIAATLARVIVLDERVQSEETKKYRNVIKYNALWPCMGIQVPSVKCADLNRPQFEEIHEFVQKFSVDFLVLHLTILEGLVEKDKQKTIQEVLNELIEDKDCEIVIVTGRGIPSAAGRSQGVKGNELQFRYLPVSALLQYLAARPSKLALMRALWHARVI